MTTTETAILAGGCFWGAQQLLRRRPGVDLHPRRLLGRRRPERHLPQSRRPRRGRGDRLRPVADLVPRHPGVLLPDPRPVDRDRQGNDIGRSYRSAIFYTNDEQKRVALDTIADVDASGLWPGKVVTEVEPAGEFWEAEDEHQDYLEKYPNGYTCHYVRPGWQLPHREQQSA